MQPPLLANSSFARVSVASTGAARATLDDTRKFGATRLKHTGFEPLRAFRYSRAGAFLLSLRRSTSNKSVAQLS